MGERVGTLEARIRARVGGCVTLSIVQPQAGAALRMAPVAQWRDAVRERRHREPRDSRAHSSLRSCRSLRSTPS